MRIFVRLKAALYGREPILQSIQLDRLLISLFFLGVSSFANSQEIKGITVESRIIVEGTPVKLSITLDESESCGLNINYGDGTTSNHRIVESSAPLVVSKAYKTKGSFQINVTGRALIRGLNSVLACGGSASTSVQVITQAEHNQAVETEARESKARAEAWAKELAEAEEKARIEREEQEMARRQQEEREAARRAEEIERARLIRDAEDRRLAEEQARNEEIKNRLINFLKVERLELIYSKGQFAIGRSPSGQTVYIKDSQIVSEAEVVNELADYRAHVEVERRQRLAFEAEQLRLADLKAKNLAYRWIVQARITFCSPNNRCWIRGIRETARNEDGSVKFTISFENQNVRGGGTSGSTEINCGFGRSNLLRMTHLEAFCQ